MSNRSKKPGYKPNQEKLISLYIKEALKKGGHLTRSDMAKLGFSRDKIRHFFGSLTNLQQESVKFDPAMEGLSNKEGEFSPEAMDELKREVKKHKRFVVTTIVDGAPLHTQFIKSLRAYCKKNKALLIFMPAGHLTRTPEGLESDHFCFEELYLNSNIHLSAIKIPAKNINPVASLGRIGQRDGSAIIASPKQFLEPVATSNLKLPHLIMSTGAATHPKYAFPGSKAGPMIRRLDYIANHDHVIGALIVEIENDEYYHIRQVQSETSGRFADQGYYYSGDKVTKVAPAAIVVGDYHVTETCPIAEEALEDQVKTLGARTLVFHDFFSGVSINHHESDKHITRAILAKQGKLDLHEELQACANVINKWTSRSDIDKIVIVESNHHEFLSKHYLQEAKYAQDPHNHLLGAMLAVAMLNGKNPLQYAIEELIKIKHPNKVVWLKRDQDYKIAGIECGAHGDKGANGSKGTPATLEKAYGQCMVGHSHSPRIMRGFWQVGTLSKLKLHYNEGPSSWLNANGVIYPNGGRTLINTINGKWRLK